VENTVSLRSDIRLPKLTSARTCSRYEKRPVVFPAPLQPPFRPEDNERMRREENEIRREHWPGEPEKRNNANARFAKSFEKLCRVKIHLQVVGLCNELKGFREKVALRVDFTSCAIWRVHPAMRPLLAADLDNQV